MLGNELRNSQIGPTASTKQITADTVLPGVFFFLSFFKAAFAVATNFTVAG